MKQQKIDPLDISAVGAKIRDHATLLQRVLWVQLCAMGLSEIAEADLEAIKTRLGLVDRYERWLVASLAMCVQQGRLALQDGHYSVAPGAVLDADAVWQAWESRQQDPETGALTKLETEALRALPAILKGDLPATDVLFPEGPMALMEGVYKHHPVADYFNDGVAGLVEAWVKARLAQDGDARLRILEIGAGTGGTSAGVFTILTPYQGHIAEYCYTDLSSAFLSHAQQTYGSEAPYLQTRLLDIEQPIAAQGLEQGGYDLVIAANVLHATRNIRRSLRNAKAALCRHGLLLLNELSEGSLSLHLTHGLLDGWWRYEDAALRIPGSPILLPETWSRVLEAEGFNRVLLPLASARDLGRQTIVAESDGVVRQQMQPREKAKPVAKREDRPERSVASSSDGSQGMPRSSRPGGDTTAAYVLEVVRESIANALKMETSELRDDLIFSEYGVDSISAVALVKEINERLGIVLPTIVLFDYSNIERLAEHIVQAYSSELSTSADSEQVISGQTETPQRPATPSSRQTGQRRRPLSDKRRQHNKAAPLAPSRRPAPLKDQDGYWRVVLEGPGDIGNIRLMQAAIPELGDEHVRIAVRAFSLNFGDLLCVRGLYPTMPAYPFTPGFEASGTVVAVGRAVKSLRVGDEVIAISGENLGGQASVVTCTEQQVISKPASLTFEQACAMPVVAMTMIEVFRKAQLKPGEKILIQTAAGGTGLIAVQLARHFGATIFATAGSQAKLDYLAGCGVEYLINYLDKDFEEEIRRLTDGAGVDVVINTLPGDAIQKGINCLAPGGRYIEIAMTALRAMKSIDLSALNNNQAFFSIDLRKAFFAGGESWAALKNEFVSLVDKKIIHPTLSQVFSFDRITEAYAYLENRGNIGKVVVKVDGEFAYEETESLSQSARAAGKEPIAIIGMSGKFAKSEDVEALWENLKQGVDLVESVNRWDLSKYINRENYCNSGSFIDEIDCFDALFFNLSGAEAACIDPQQRLFLEEAWKAFEDAGYAGEAVDGHACGVYVGCGSGDYQLLFNGEVPAQSFWGNAASITASRIAYHLNLKGPAIAVDTACSSSLVAIHMACQGLWSGETTMALAGGVFLQITPQFHLLSQNAGMLSLTGHCHSFDARADGFVPGEGVGVVVLKRLSEAMADGDHIYGVIAGSGMNQDGTTNGITAPSFLSQERLERSVYDGFGISPAEIQMVEAHGTGTALGDPIEFHALTSAFRAYTDKKAYCALGSIKTNLGHTAMAAGVASVIKVLLSLKHQAMPPSLHYQQTNPNIAMEESPFFVNTALRDWTVAPGDKRRAAVSSFGFSGTNVHLVIEEAPASAQSSVEKPGYLIVLSARNKERLQQQVERLIAHCEIEASMESGNLSFTLLMGRKHFSHRLACVIRNRDELVKTLRKWLDKGQAAEVYTSVVSQDQPERPWLKRLGADCIKNCRVTGTEAKYLENLKMLADLYVQGYRLQFGELFEKGCYQRISLPSYPFARERYWVTDTAEAATSVMTQDAGVGRLHPLLHRNTSNQWGQRFTSIFSGDECFIADYVVAGRRVLPSVAYLELARAAVEQFADRAAGLLLEDVVWLRPLVVDESALQVHIGLYPEEDGSIGYEIYNGAEDENGEPVIFGQGRAVVANPSEHPAIDLEALQARCHEWELPGEELFGHFQSGGIDYGPAYRGLECLAVGRDASGRPEALASLTLPKRVDGTGDDYWLHPSLMDAALQAVSGLTLEEGHDRAYVPFAVDEVRIWSGTPERGWAWVRYSASDEVNKYDIDLCDETGSVCVCLAGLSVRAMEGGEFPPRSDEYVPQAALTDAQADLLEKKLQAALIQAVSKQLNIKVDEIELDNELIEYGFDSISFSQFTSDLNQRYGLELRPTIAFEYPTLGKLAHHLVDAHGGILAAHFAPSDPTTGAVEKIMNATAQRLARQNGRPYGMAKRQRQALAEKAVEMEQSPPREQAPDKVEKSRWFVLRKPNRGAKVKLFCLPYAGAGASIFRGWQGLLPDEIEVCPIQLPGKETRIKERFIDDIDTCVDALCEALSPELDQPYALYGHSIGGLIAYRLAFRLNQIHEHKPRHLFVGGSSSPSVPSNRLNHLLRRMLADTGYDQIPEQTDLLAVSEEEQNRFIDLLTTLMPQLNINSELGKELLPSLLAELNLLQSFSWDGTRFSLPVTAFHGMKDELVSEEEMLAWQALTSGPFACHQVSGDHLFISPDQDLHLVVKHISQDLSHLYEPKKCS